MEFTVILIPYQGTEKTENIETTTFHYLVSYQMIFLEGDFLSDFIYHKTGIIGIHSDAKVASSHSKIDQKLANYFLKTEFKTSA